MLSGMSWFEAITVLLAGRAIILTSYAALFPDSGIDLSSSRRRDTLLDSASMRCLSWPRSFLRLQSVSSIGSQTDAQPLEMVQKTWTVDLWTLS